MTKHLDYDTALALLNKAVETKGADFKYKVRPVPSLSSNHSMSGCVYNEEDGSPSCIVGYVLADLGVTVPTEYQTKSIDRVLADGVLDLTVSKDAEHLLGCAQTQQDCGSTWGDAVDTAVRRNPKGLGLYAR